MPAHRRPTRAVILHVPSLNPYSQSNPSNPSRINSNKSDSDSNSNPTTTLSIPPLIGKPIDGGTNTTSTSLTTSISSNSNSNSTETAPTSTTASTSNQDDSQSKSKSSTSDQTITTTPTELQDAQASAAQWNSLLIWARKRRGPQWDPATGIWQVDRESQEYYSFCSDPSRGVEPIPESSLAGSKDKDDEGSPPPIAPGRVGRGRWKRDKGNNNSQQSGLGGD